tara:strand:+ start:281 stop:535 length:255 start_codon:yes stop_codon:yes gene_type:complete
MGNNKKIYKKFCDIFLNDTQKKINNVVHEFFNKDAKINVVEPINEIKGAEELLKKFFLPMLKSFPDLYRRTDIFFQEFLKIKNG